jgi:thiosulfate/3-mercaptopyruvate sulfurtransferase
MEYLIDTTTLQDQLSNPHLKIVEASWDLTGHDYRLDFLQSAIPGSVFFDIEALSDHPSPFPHRRLDHVKFSAAMGELGLKQTDDIIVYDRTYQFSAPRCAWNLRSMGASSVRILNGGFAAWRELYLPSPGISSMPKSQFQATEIEGFWIEMEALKNLYYRPEVCILDARSQDRFKAHTLETRLNTRSGHIPGSKSLHYNKLIQKGFFRNRDELIEILTPILNPRPEIITTTCGSGITAAILATAIEIAGFNRPVIFDGSWAEWGHVNSGQPVARG